MKASRFLTLFGLWAWAITVTVAAQEQPPYTQWIRRLDSSSSGSSQCCDKCLAQKINGHINFDPTVFSQCQKGGLCCFDCGSFTQPDYSSDVEFDSDGTTPTIKTGKWLKFQWQDVKEVTFLRFRENQKKTDTPNLQDSKAKTADDYFMICPKNVGKIVMRGWGSDTCRQASGEVTIKVLEGDGDDTCSDSAPPAPTHDKDDNSKSEHKDKNADCNLQRASIINDECVCVSDWSNPPACDQLAPWKWAVTIAGAVAAFFSILVSARALWNRHQEKKRKQEEEDEAGGSAVAVLEPPNDQKPMLNKTPEQGSTAFYSTTQTARNSTQQGVQPHRDSDLQQLHTISTTGSNDKHSRQSTSFDL